MWSSMLQMIYFIIKFLVEFFSLSGFQNYTNQLADSDTGQISLPEENDAAEL